MDKSLIKVGEGHVHRILGSRSTTAPTICPGTGSFLLLCG